VPLYAFALYLATKRNVVAPPMIFAIFTEKCRLTMKLISFVVESNNKQANSNSESDNKTLAENFSSRQQLLYFLFAPTLLYRDNYPRNERIRWGSVCSFASQFVFSLFLFSLMFHKYVIPKNKLLFTQSIPAKEFAEIIFCFSLLGAISTFMISFTLLHLWMNFWADLLRFADREFCSDWWNCTNAADFLRKWNLIVYEWNHTYIYVPLLKKTNKNKFFSVLVVFFLSNLVHEYIDGFAFRYSLFLGVIIFFMLMLISGTYMLLKKIFNTIFGFVVKNFWKSENIQVDHEKKIRVPSKIFWYSSQNLNFSTFLVFFFSMYSVSYFLEYFAHEMCPLAQNDTKYKKHFTFYFFKCIHFR